jgi:putative MFS transporter
VLSFSVLVYMFVDALTSVAQGFWSLSFFRFLTGTGTGMELPAGSTFIAEAVHHRWRSRMNAIMGFAYPAGYLVAIAFFATIGAMWGWRAVFVASLLPGIFVFIIRRRLAESPRFQAALERLKRGEVKRDKVSNITVFRRPYCRDSLPACLYWTGNAFSFWATATFFPLYLVKVRHLPIGVELTWFATYQVWCVIIWYLTGWLSDAWARRPAAILLSILSFLSIWGMTLVSNGVPLYIFGALAYCLLSGPWIVSFAHSAEIFPTHIRGSGIGTTLGIGRVVSIAAPVVFGALAARYGIAIAFRLGSISWILTIIGYLFSRETGGIELAQIAGENLIPPSSLMAVPEGSE